MKTRRSRINENQKITLTLRQLKRLVRESRKINESEDEFYDYFEWLKNVTQFDSGIHVDWNENDKHQVIQMTFDEYYGWDDDVEDGKKSKLSDSGVKEWIRQFQKKDGKVDDEGLAWKFWKPRIVDDKYDGEVVVLTLTKEYNENTALMGMYGLDR